jgi:hypothetical protein
MTRKNHNMSLRPHRKVDDPATPVSLYIFDPYVEIRVQVYTEMVLPPKGHSLGSLQEQERVESGCCCDLRSLVKMDSLEEHSLEKHGLEEHRLEFCQIHPGYGSCDLKLSFGCSRSLNESLACATRTAG